MIPREEGDYYIPPRTSTQGQKTTTEQQYQQKQEQQVQTLGTSKPRTRITKAIRVANGDIAYERWFDNDPSTTIDDTFAIGNSVKGDDLFAEASAWADAHPEAQFDYTDRARGEALNAAGYQKPTQAQNVAPAPATEAAAEDNTADEMSKQPVPIVKLTYGGNTKAATVAAVNPWTRQEYDPNPDPWDVQATDWFGAPIPDADYDPREKVVEWRIKRYDGQDKSLMDFTQVGFFTENTTGMDIYDMVNKKQIGVENPDDFITRIVETPDATPWINQRNAQGIPNSLARNPFVEQRKAEQAQANNNMKAAAAGIGFDIALGNVKPFAENLAKVGEWFGGEVDKHFDKPYTIGSGPEKSVVRGILDVPVILATMPNAFIGAGRETAKVGAVDMGALPGFALEGAGAVVKGNIDAAKNDPLRYATSFIALDLIGGGGLTRGVLKTGGRAVARSGDVIDSALNGFAKELPESYMKGGATKTTPFDTSYIGELKGKSNARSTSYAETLKADKFGTRNDGIIDNIFKDTDYRGGGALPSQEGIRITPIEKGFGDVKPSRANARSNSYQDWMKSGADNAYLRDIKGVEIEPGVFDFSGPKSTIGFGGKVAETWLGTSKVGRITMMGERSSGTVRRRGTSSQRMILEEKPIAPEIKTIDMTREIDLSGMEPPRGSDMWAEEFGMKWQKTKTSAEIPSRLSASRARVASLKTSSARGVWAIPELSAGVISKTRTKSDAFSISGSKTSQKSWSFLETEPMQKTKTVELVRTLPSLRVETIPGFSTKTLSRTDVFSGVISGTKSVPKSTTKQSNDQIFGTGTMRGTAINEFFEPSKSKMRIPLLDDDKSKKRKKKSKSRKRRVDWENPTELVLKDIGFGLGAPKKSKGKKSRSSRSRDPLRMLR